MAREATIAFEEPKAAKWLFGSTQASWIWLVVRIWLGWQWFTAGLGKLTGVDATGYFGWHLHFAMTNESWLRDGGASLKGFAMGAIANASGSHPSVTYAWYVDLLKWIANTSAPWMSWVISFGETAVGIGLILGCLTGIAAFFGGMLTLSFGLAGSAGVNPMFFFTEVLLILAWRNAGWYGLDRVVLPALGTPWQKGRLFRQQHPVAHAAA